MRVGMTTLQRVLHSAIAMLGLLFCTTCVQGGGKAFDYNTFDRDIRASLPVGSNYENVERYLQGKNISYSLVERENKVYALIPDVKKGPIVSESVQIIIALDEQKRVRSVDVKPVYTGP
jgi:hypothetical protein